MRGRPSCLLQSAGGEANRILLASALSSMRIICPNRVSRRDWIIAVSLACFISLRTSSFCTNWYHLMPSSTRRHHPAARTTQEHRQDTRRTGPTSLRRRAVTSKSDPPSSARQHERRHPGGRRHKRLRLTSGQESQGKPPDHHDALAPNPDGQRHPPPAAQSLLCKNKLILKQLITLTVNLTYMS